LVKKEITEPSAQVQTDKSDRNRQEVEYWTHQLNMLLRTLENGNESGLLKDKAEEYQKIVNNITAARRDLSRDKPDVIEARKKYSLAYSELNRHVNKEDFSWRFRYCYGGPALLYLLSVLAIILLSWIWFRSSLVDSDLLWVPSWAFLWGSMGGVFQGFWSLWRHTSDRDLRGVWYIWYILLPLIGALLGALAYLIFVAGFIAAVGETQIRSQSFVMLFAALAGFSSKWAVQILGKLTEIIKIG